MKHFTSYYANFNNIPSNYMCVGISRTCPDWFVNSDLPNFMFVKNNFLAPSEKILTGYKNGTITQEEYKREYITDVLTKVVTELHKKDFPSWVTELDTNFSTTITKWDGIVFLCYESPNDFCHRHLLRKLMTNVYHIPCDELVPKGVPVWGETVSSNSKELF